jgi:hypothetical protein
MNKNKWFIGLNVGKNKREAFLTDTPTQEKWGETYNLLIGPFKTKRGALFCANNPQSPCQNVNEYEKAGYKDYILNADFNPSNWFWNCPSCYGLNVWAYCDLEKLVSNGFKEENIFIATGSCFDNVCGKCRADYVKKDSPIMAECYTH